jgi:hypothetical protein
MEPALLTVGGTQKNSMGISKNQIGKSGVMEHSKFESTIEEPKIRESMSDELLQVSTRSIGRCGTNKGRTDLDHG